VLLLPGVGIISQGDMMNEDEDVQPRSIKSNPLIRRVGVYAAVLLVVFLLGLIPMWLKARQSANGLAQAERQLSLARIQNNLASAVIDARRGEYEPARQTASQFFTSLREETDKGDASALTQSQRDGMQPLFARRDEIITLLARSDPAAADRLSDLYVLYRKLMNS
jgi:hypothetical protein